MKTKQQLFVKRLEGQPDLHKRPFTTLKVASIALLAGLIAGPMVFPRALRAQDTTSAATSQQSTMVVQGKALSVVKLDKPLVELEKATSKYHEEYYECLPNSAHSSYTNFITMPDAHFGVTFDSADHYNPYLLTVAFPASREKNPSKVKEPGYRAADLTDFANLVKACTGKPLERVKLIAQTGTFDNNGVEMVFTNLFIIAVNPAGKAIACLGEGKYLMFGASYFGDELRGDVAVLAEPTTAYSIQIAIASR